MIKNFSVFYVGNIDLEDVGLDGIPANDRTYKNERLVQSMETAEKAAVLMDELGYYYLWMEEHHFLRFEVVGHKSIFGFTS